MRLRPSLIALTVPLLAGTGCVPFPEKTDTTAIENEFMKDALAEMPAVDVTSPLSWDSFDDPVLAELIDRALENNLLLKSQRLSLESAQISLEAVRTRLLPVVTLTGPNVSINRARNQSTQQSYAFSGLASYEVDLWGSVRNDVTSQEFVVENIEDLLQTSRISVAALVARNYFALRRQDEVIRLQREQLKILGEQRRLTEINMQAGVTTRQPLDQLDVSIETLLSAIERATIDRRATLQFLASLLGLPVQQFSLPAVPFDAPAIPRLAVTAPAVLLAQRPDVRIAERNIRGADLSVENARAAWLPQLNASANASTSVGSTAALGDLLSDETLISSIGLSLQTLLFDTGFRQRNIEQNRIFREQAILDYQGVIIDALADIDNALNDQYENTLQIEIQQRQEAAQRRVTATTQILYQTGDATAFDLITEQGNILNVQQRRVDNWLAGMTASVSLLQALGVDPLSDDS